MNFSFKKFTFSGNKLPKPKKVSGTGEFKTTPKGSKTSGKAGGKTKVSTKGSKMPSPKKAAAPKKVATPKTAKPPKPKKVKM